MPFSYQQAETTEEQTCGFVSNLWFCVKDQINYKLKFKELNLSTGAYKKDNASQDMIHMNGSDD